MDTAQRLALKIKTPRQVQAYLRRLPYNREKKGRESGVRANGLAPPAFTLLRSGLCGRGHS